MWITAILQLLFPALSKILDKFIPDANSVLAAKREVLDLTGTLLHAKKDIIMAEVQSEHWLQRSWRPMVGWSFSLMAIIMIFSSDIVRPYFHFFTGIWLPELEVSGELWYAVFFCLGGYMGCRTIEKVVRMLKF
jgi:hypothetical protein